MQDHIRHSSRPRRWALLGAIAGLALCLGCERNKSAEEATQTASEGKSAEESMNAREAAAKLAPTEGNTVSGTVRFEPTDEGVLVTATIDGLEPETLHGFHIHEKGDCSAPDATSAGGHFAPDGHPHGLPPSENRHAGDMGNIVSDSEGTAKIERTFNTFSLDGKSSVTGRAVIVHAQEDRGTQPTGDAGARVACGVIEKS